MMAIHHALVTGGLSMAHSPHPPVADIAPDADVVTHYDQQHYITYLRLLDAESEGADWHEVAKIVLHLDPANDELRARQAWESHLARAHWLTKNHRHVMWRGTES
jgi:hypothetical protein